MLYISDIYNVETKEHFKHINPNIRGQVYYCVELRDFVTGEQRALCRPNVVLENKYIHSLGVVNPNRLQVLERSFIDLLSYVDVEFAEDNAIVTNNMILAHNFILKNKDFMWYAKMTPLTYSGGGQMKYLNLFEFLVALQTSRPDINFYEVGIKYIKLSKVIIKVTVEKDLTVAITKYMIRRNK